MLLNLSTRETTRLREIKDLSGPQSSQVTCTDSLSLNSLYSISFFATFYGQCSLFARFVRSPYFSSRYDWFWSYLCFHQQEFCQRYVYTNSASLSSSTTLCYWWYSNFIWRYHSYHYTSGNDCQSQSFWGYSIGYCLAWFSSCYSGITLVTEACSFYYLVSWDYQFQLLLLSATLQQKSSTCGPRVLWLCAYSLVSLASSRFARSSYPTG